MEDHDDWIIVQVDMLLVPTVLQNYLIAEVEAEEKTATSPTWDKNTLSGRFTNFVNLLDMAAISVPSAILQSPDLRNEASETGETLHCLSSLSSHPFLSNHYLFAQSDTPFSLLAYISQMFQGCPPSSFKATSFMSSHHILPAS